MSKRFIVLLLLVVFAFSFFAGCSASKSGKSTANYDMAATQPAMAKESYSDSGENGGMAQQETRAGALNETADTKEQPEEDQAVDSIAGGGDASQNVTNAILSERKVIRSANVTVEVEVFDEAYAKLDTMILGIGFIQSTSINSEKYYVEGGQKLLRRGTITIRVDRAKFDTVLNNIKGIGEILSWNINGEDVTDKYFDTESRLRLLRIEESKLEEYLKKLNDLDQIFKTESRLTEIRYQIESLTGNLKKMSDLVELSTISINMNEKRPGSDDPVKPQTYGQKLLDNFLASIKGVTGFIGDVIVVLVAAVPILVLIGVFVLLGVLIYRKIPKKKSQVEKTSMIVQSKENPDNEKNQ